MASIPCSAGLPGLFSFTFLMSRKSGSSGGSAKDEGPKKGVWISERVLGEGISCGWRLSERICWLVLHCSINPEMLRKNIHILFAMQCCAVCNAMTVERIFTPFL